MAVNDPVDPGVKVTLIRQEPLAATAVLVEQVVPVVAMAKALALVPLNAMLAMVRAEVVGLLSVKVCAVLVEPTNWALKVRLEGERLTPGVPVPERDTV